MRIHIIVVIALPVLLHASLATAQSAPEPGKSLKTSVADIANPTEQARVYLNRAEEMIESVFWTPETQRSTLTFTAALQAYLNNTKEASRTIEKLVNEDDRDFAWLSVLGVSLELGKVREASGYLEYISMPYHQSLALKLLAGRYLKQNNHAKCSEMLDRACSLIPEVQGEYGIFNEQCYEMIDMAVEAGDIKSASRLADYLVGDFQKVKGLGILGAALGKKGQTAECEAALRKAEAIIGPTDTKSSPKIPELCLVAEAWGRAGNKTKGKEFLDRAVRAMGLLPESKQTEYFLAALAQAKSVVVSVTSGKELASRLSANGSAFQLLDIAKYQYDNGDMAGTKITRQEARAAALKMADYPGKALGFREIAERCIAMEDLDMAREFLPLARNEARKLKHEKSRSNILSLIAETESKVDDIAGIELTTSLIPESEGRWGALSQVGRKTAFLHGAAAVEKLFEKYKDPQDQTSLLLGAAFGCLELNVADKSK